MIHFLKPFREDTITESPLINPIYDDVSDSEREEPIPTSFTPIDQAQLLGNLDLLLEPTQTDSADQA